jgi:flagellar protein FlaG
MAISTESMVAGNGLQHRQTTNSLAADGAGVQRAASANAKVDQTAASVVRHAADAKPEIDKPSNSQLKHSLEDINKVLAGFSISVQFQVDPDYKDLIVRIVDQDSGKLIRQMPTEDVVRMSKAMDNLKGLLFSQAV